MNAALCLACAKDTPDTGHLCTSCIGRLRRNLADLADLWPLLDDLLAPASRGSGGNGKPGSRPAANLAVIDATDARGTIAVALHGWARVVVEDRRLSHAPADMPGVIALLALHVTWIAEQPWVDELIKHDPDEDGEPPRPRWVGEVDQATRVVRGITGDLPEAPLGLCNRQVERHGKQTECGGVLAFPDDIESALVCARCGDRWTEADLAHILRVTQPARKFPVARDWVTQHHQVTDTQLRQWVSRGLVRTYADRQVDLFDVLKRVRP